MSNGGGAWNTGLALRICSYIGYGFRRTSSENKSIIGSEIYFDCVAAVPATLVVVNSLTPEILESAFQNVEPGDSEAGGIRWWEQLTGRGGEGMVVKPLEFIAQSRRGLVQPAVKCRGRGRLPH
jgi:hypothetical protein